MLTAEEEAALTRDYSPWIGLPRRGEMPISLWPARALTATLDGHPDAIVGGDALPPGWHWIYMNDAVRASELGPDGHEARGGFLPDVPLPRRMWAGGRIGFHAPLHIGEMAERTSVVETVSPKRGRSGALVFVTVRHTVTGPHGMAVDEEQDLVYRTPPPASKPHSAAVAAAGARPPEGAKVVRTFRADAVTLFRFSAVTFNGHRIHYDHPYATDEEGYPGLVVHGPLLALLLLGQGAELLRRPPRTFEYRGLSPVFCGEEIELRALPSPLAPDGEIRLWAEHPERGLAMEARIR